MRVLRNVAFLLPISIVGGFFVAILYLSIFFTVTQGKNIAEEVTEMHSSITTAFDDLNEALHHD